MSEFKPRVVQFMPLFLMALMGELLQAEEKWGDTWLERPRKGQSERIVERINTYYANWLSGEKEGNFPYLAVAGLALIGWVRDTYTDASDEWTEPDEPQS